MTTKDIPMGVVTNNECCICCDKCWDNKPLDANSGCPRSCCTCPPLNDLCMTLHCDQCPTVDGMELTLSKSLGVALCSGENPTTRDGQIKCYEYNPISTLQSGIQGYYNEYEKWGYTGIICNGLTVAGCGTATAGEKLKVSLCCCNEPDEHINATILTPADCHTCSYRLTFEWERHVDNSSSDADDFCSCPEPDAYGATEQIIPTCETAGPPIDCAITYLDLTFESGTCPTGNPSPGSPFFLHYELRTNGSDRRGWWNCDCCQNGVGASDNDVLLEVSIVEGGGTDGACS